jgi:hypothetical protein
MVAKAYDDPDLVENIFDNADPEIKSIGNVLRDRALGYYRARGRRCKAVLALCGGPLQGGLRARLCFKLAHFNEFRGTAWKAATSSRCRT